MTMTVTPDSIHVCESTFARSLGFETFDELVEASEPVVSLDGELWYIVPLPVGHWLAWPFPEWDDSHRFATREDAIEFTWPS
ncbi:MAG TPA: hypothetical protein VFG20_11335, partial [Planctomycetaceae bacterium]|nr:hypothetical protein [Planctomycetaceae bacterium]